MGRLLQMMPVVIEVDEVAPVEDVLVEDVLVEGQEAALTAQR